MYVNQPWTIRQYAGSRRQRIPNAFLSPQSRGRAEGLSVAFDLATHRGYDSDHPRVSATSAWRVWRSTRSTTCARCSRHPLDQMSVSMTMNGAVLPILALFVAAAQEQAVPPEKLSGTIRTTF